MEAGVDDARVEENLRPKHKNSLWTRICRCTKEVLRCRTEGCEAQKLKEEKKRKKYSPDYLEDSYSDYEDAETSPNYRPTGILALCKKTKFNETEIKRIYRGFKSECPSGTVDEDSFKDIYCRMFPQGANASQYAHYVFHSLDQDQTGVLNFEDFVLALSTLARGDLEEKVKWVFTLYDLNGDGFITRKELADVAVSVFELMGKYVHPPLDGNDISLRVDAQFDKMDKNKDGVVTWEEFLAFFTQEDVSLSLNYLETIM